MTIESYILHAEEENKPTLRRQWRDAQDGTIVCPSCQENKPIHLAYRCLYCGIWFCCNCAEMHFEQTVDEWLEEKRMRKRCLIQHMLQKEKTTTVKAIIEYSKTIAAAYVGNFQKDGQRSPVVYEQGIGMEQLIKMVREKFQ